MVDSMEKIVALCKSRGYVYPGSEIYGGLANTWDYGPLGNELKTILKLHGERNLFKNNQIFRIRCSNINESRNMGSFWSCWRNFRSIN